MTTNEESLPVANPADVASIDAIITAAYDVISGPAGKKRDWDRERSLFFPGARLIPTAVKAGEESGDLSPRMLDVDAYIARVEPFFAANGFYEKEIARRTEQFGDRLHLLAARESRESDSSEVSRGWVNC